MKKIIVSAFLLGLIYTTTNAQSIMPSEPTTSSISSYVNVAVSQSTGVPNIEFPLYQLETMSTGLPINLVLSYHVYNAKANVPAGEAGLGWSIFTSGSISRKVVGANIDEIKNWSDVNEEEADIFYYNIPGHSGKFKIYKDQDSGNLILNNISGEKIKIEFERDLSGSKLIINSFKIIDGNGTTYLFQEYNLGYYGKTGIDNYRTTFVLTKVLDPKSQEVISYTYDKKIKYIGTSSVISYQYCKANTISTGKGKIKFEYDYNSFYDNPDKANDPYSIKSISFTDNSDRLLSKYQFVYGSMDVPYEKYSFGLPEEVTSSKRILTKLQKLDKNLNTDEETIFDYDQTGSDTQYGYYADNSYGNILCTNNPFINPKKYTLGLLKKVTFPTKGYVNYTFEANTEYVDKSIEDYSGATSIIDPEVQYYALTNTIPFDTNSTRTYQFQMSGTAGVSYPVYIRHEMTEDYMETDVHGILIPQSYTVKSSDNIQVNPDTGICTTDAQTKVYSVKPGTATITLKGGGKGVFKIYGIRSLPKPYKNEHPVKQGARIKLIQSFDADGTPVKTKKFDYTPFTGDPGSSGYSFGKEGCMYVSNYESSVLYKNVKETETTGTENNGYIKYYFKTPSDYIQPSNTTYFPYYNIVSDGILEKKEVYNRQNQVMESSDFEYTIQEIPNTKQYNVCLGNTKPAWMQNIKQTDKTYLSSAPYQTISETTFNPDNFKESFSKITAQDGSVTETTTKYASDLGNTRFINVNMISVPLQIETKTDGTVMTKVTTKYDNPSHFYPTSLESTDLNQTSETQVTFDLYDNKGNLVQTTDKSGNSVTTIWGYNQTLPIAQITGAKYNDISSLSVVTAAINASNADAADPANEGALLTALNNLRLASQLQEYSMTLYTYDPLVGITNTISSNGIKNTYQYDNSGRLLNVKNSEGQVLKENQYNYKH